MASGLRNGESAPPLFMSSCRSCCTSERQAVAHFGQPSSDSSFGAADRNGNLFRCQPLKAMFDCSSLDRLELQHQPMQFLSGSDYVGGRRFSIGQIRESIGGVPLPWDFLVNRPFCGSMAL